MNASISARAARINDVYLHPAGVAPAADDLRQRACTELLRQAAQREGLLATDDRPGEDGAISAAAAEAIEVLLDRVLAIPTPDDAQCRRHYDANRSRFATGARVLARHILFAVTPGLDVVALRKRAEACLLEVRCHDDGADDPFAAAARTLSNCPSGAGGGALGWLAPADCAPEFARALFAGQEIGVLPCLVHSRFGLHVVEVLARDPGSTPEFERVRGAVESDLRQRAFVAALRQYLRILAAAADIDGVTLDAAATPLVGA